MPTTHKIYVGTSGWDYNHWQEIFYPSNLPRRERLSFYTRHFSAVEINNTFYQLPTKKIIKKWYKNAPPDFLFAVKANRFITHRKKLKNSKEALHNFLALTKSFKEKLGPILFQLPPRWRINSERLQMFLKLLPKGRQYVFEFRDPSWFDPRIYELLKIHRAAFCIHDFYGNPSPEELTADFVYLRFHGPTGRYQGKYSHQQLTRWTKKIVTWSKEVREVYCYFNNDMKAYAVQNAQELQRLLKTRLPGVKFHPVITDDQTHTMLSA